MRALNFRWLILAACSSLLIGCVYSSEPLSGQTNSQPDTKLIGTWSELNSLRTCEHRTLTISRDPKDQNQLLFVYDDRTHRDSGRENGRLLSTQIGNDRFASASRLPKETHGTFWVFPYEIRQERFLGLWYPDEAAFRQAVENGEIKGQVDWSGAVALTDTIENLRKYIEKNGQKLFRGDSDTGHPTVYIRDEE